MAAVMMQAHGTNPASAMIAGYEIVIIASKDGMVDPKALKEALTDDVAALMMTCPNTLGLFETHLPEIVENYVKSTRFSIMTEQTSMRLWVKCVLATSALTLCI